VEALKAAEGKDFDAPRNKLWGGKGGGMDPDREANLLLLDWLEKNGVYISEKSGWGEAPVGGARVHA
jgi:hypothetical protein